MYGNLPFVFVIVKKQLIWGFCYKADFNRNFSLYEMSCILPVSQFMILAQQIQPIPFIMGVSLELMDWMNSVRALPSATNKKGPTLICVNPLLLWRVILSILRRSNVKTVIHR